MPSNLDKSLRDSLGSFEAPYSASHWDRLARQLDARKKRAAMLPLRVTGLLLITGLAAFGAWRMIDIRSDQTVVSENNPVELHTQPSLVAEQPQQLPESVDRPYVAPVVQDKRSGKNAKKLRHVSPSSPMAVLPYTKLHALSASTIASNAHDMPSGTPVWVVEESLRPSPWRLHLNLGPGFALSKPLAVAGSVGAGLSVKVGKGWVATLGLGLTKVNLPGHSGLTASYPSNSAMKFVKSKLLLGEVAINFEHHFGAKGRFRPYAYLGTSVLLPVRETYYYQEQPVISPPSQEGTGTVVYSGLDAAVGANKIVGPLEAPHYSLQPYLGVVQGGVGLTCNISEQVSLRGSMEFQTALRPIGLENQNFRSISGQIGAVFDVFGPAQGALH